MSPLVVVSVAAGLLAAIAVLRLVSPVLAGRRAWPALVTALVTTTLTIGAGVIADVATLDYLIGLCAFTLPVLVLLEAAAIAAGADSAARWVLMLVWGVAVFPIAAVVPLFGMLGCDGPGCGFNDFAGALPLFASASAFVVLAWRPAGAPAAAVGAIGSGRAVAAVLAFWAAYVVWLASLEAAIDHYTLRILLAGVVGPLSGAVGWLLVDVGRGAMRAPAAGFASGLVAGMAAAASGAVTVSFPWSALVGGLAGAVAALAHAGLVGGTAATRWGVAVLAATAVGFLAPPISGDTVGVLFSAQVSVLLAPLMAIVGVSVWSALASAPAWVLLRRSVTRRGGEERGSVEQQDGAEPAAGESDD